MFNRLKLIVATAWGRIRPIFAWPRLPAVVATLLIVLLGLPLLAAWLRLMIWLFTSTSPVVASLGNAGMAIIQYALWPTVVIVFFAMFQRPLAKLIANVKRVEGAGFKLETEQSTGVARISNDPTDVTKLEIKATQSSEQPRRTQLPHPSALEPIERKILNTLWRKQVNRIEDWRNGQAFMFKVGKDDPEYLLYFSAIHRLIGLKLIALQPDQYMASLSKWGFAYCKLFYSELGDAEWFPGQLNEDKLRSVLAKTRNLSADYFMHNVEFTDAEGNVLHGITGKTSVAFGDDVE